MSSDNEGEIFANNISENDNEINSNNDDCESYTSVTNISIAKRQPFFPLHDNSSDSGSSDEDAGTWS